MKTLYLVRHAEAIPRDTGINDFKRALTKSGKNEAQAMSKRLKKKGVIPELLVSSPDVRALETAHIFANALGYPSQKIVLKEEIYDKDDDALKEIIKGIDETYTTVMLFGHNPALSDLAKGLLRDFDTEIRKSGVVGIGFNIASWHDLSAEAAMFLLFDFPVRATPKVYKKAKKVMAHEFTATMEGILEQLDVTASKQVEKILQKTSKQLAKEVLKVLEASKVEDIAGIRKEKRVDNLLRAEVPENKC